MTELPDVPGESQATAFVVSPEQILEPDAPVGAPAAPEQAAVEPAAAEPPAGESSGLIPPRRRGHSGRFITDVLVELGHVTPEQVEWAISESRAAGKAPEEVLLGEGLINSDQLSRAVAERYGLDYVDLNQYKVDMGAANLVSVTSARRSKAIPVGHIDKDTLLLAVADPANVLAVDDIQMATGLNCRVAVAAQADIDALIGRLDNLSSAVDEAIGEAEDGETDDSAATDLRASAEDAPVIKLVFSILGQAANEGASDIHFEPGEDDLRVRFRVDGVLREAAHVPKKMISGVVSRLKIMGLMDIAEKRVPQDGRVSVNLEDRRVDLRIVTLPTQRGEGAAIRILDKSNAVFTLDEVGLDGESRERFESSVRRPYGAVLVTGPTGSGKSTSLYGALQEVNDIEKNIITIEDPVEYRLNGINQINVNRKAGLTFATGLRSILRADPDIIMVGEIRDAETARIAIEAALTGHMVLSTLHTNDAPGAITRLAKMGIEPFLTASAVDCVVAQRLARKLCESCKRQTTVSAEALRQSGFAVDDDLEVYESVGCTRCSGTGYRGRIGLFSVMVMTEEIKDMAISLAPESEIAMAARAGGMKTLREAGLAKVIAGETSIEEVARVAT
jgi:type IV pilus assembly protein PilB